MNISLLDRYPGCCIMNKLQLIIISIVFLVLLSGCASRTCLVKEKKPGQYCIKGKTYQVLKHVPVGHREQGIASWYGPNFHGKKTASGEVYDMHRWTAAHKTLPLNTLVEVTNPSNNRKAVVRINDRGPFIDGRVIDLSLTAAKYLGVVEPGTAPVKIAVVGKLGPTVAAKKSRAPRLSAEPSPRNPYLKAPPKRKVAQL